MTRACLLCCLLASAGLGAQELVVRDLRLGLTSRPTDFDYTLSSPTAQRSGSDAVQAPGGVELGGRWSLIRSGDRVGLLLGGDLRFDAQGYKGGGGLDGQGLRLCTGVAGAIDDRWTAALEIAWDYGRSQLSLPGNSSRPALDAKGRASGWDVRLTTERMLNRRIGLGAMVGWEQRTHDLSGSGVDLHLDQAGWFFGIELRWRFSDRPPLLD